MAELHEDHDLLLKLYRHFVLLEAHVQLIQAPLELRLVLVDVLDVVRYVAEDHAGEDEAEDHVRGRQPGLRSAGATSRLESGAISLPEDMSTQL